MEFQKHTINKDVPIPLYYQVKQIILDEINNGIGTSLFIVFL